MARKHGFSGTPVRPSNRPSSMGGIFEKRGDPMVSPREGLEKFGRNLETENPDYDRFFAKVARDQLKPSQVDKGNAFRKLTAKDNYDPQKAAANIVLKMRSKMREKEPTDLAQHLQNRGKDLIYCPYKCGFSSRDSHQVTVHLRNEGRHADCRLSPEERDRKRRRERNG